MSRWFTTLLVVVAALAAAATATGAQGLQEMEVTDSSVSDDNEVVLTVKAPAVLAGVDIPTSAFVVSENGQPRAVAVERLPNEGLEVVLVIDTSGSMEPSIAGAQSAAIGFLDVLPEEAEIGVIGFADDAAVVARRGDDRATTTEAVLGLQATGGTSLYDALVLATTQFDRADDSTRRAIVVLSDGEDTTSVATIAEAQQAMSAANASVDLIALADATNDTSVLRSLAGAAAFGRVVEVLDPTDLDAVYDDLGTALVNQYQVRIAAQGEGPAEIDVLLQHLGVVGQGRADVELVGLPEVAAPAQPESAEEAAPLAVTPSTSRVVSGDGGPLGDRGLAVGVAAFFAAVAIFLFALLRSVDEVPRLEVVHPADLRSGFAGAGERAAMFTERIFARGERGSAIAKRLESAGWSMRPGEFIGLAIGSALLVFMVGVLVLPFVTAVTLGMLAAACWPFVLGRRMRRRQAAFASQQSQLLQLLAGNLRVGRGLNQALEGVAKEMPEPSCSELRRVVTEVRLGRELDESLSAMSERVASPDFPWVVEAISINREVGGDLAEVLDNVRSTINDRERVAAMVQSLSAEGRLTAYLLVALPPLLVTYLLVVNPEYLRPFVEEPAGLAMGAIAIALMGAGIVWIRKLLRFAY